jgi:hypothetical protein
VIERAGGLRAPATVVARLWELLLPHPRLPGCSELLLTGAGLRLPLAPLAALRAELLALLSKLLLTHALPAHLAELTGPRLRLALAPLAAGGAELLSLPAELLPAELLALLAEPARALPPLLAEAAGPAELLRAALLGPLIQMPLNAAPDALIPVRLLRMNSRGAGEHHDGRGRCG